MTKQRLDTLLVARGLATDVEEAMRLCLAGEVICRDAVLTKPGMSIEDSSELTLKRSGSYVSRGGEKLAGALSDFELDPTDLRCIDIGASTGGFTDCLLQHGAAQVTAVDVGYGQFAWSLRSDHRVVLHERKNIRELDPALVGAPFDLLVADLSFIGLANLFPQFKALVAGDGQLLVLVKPQFELPASAVARGGVVDEAEAHIQALKRVLAAAESQDLALLGLAASHLKGPKGNIEFFFWARVGGIPATIDSEAVVHKAWADFGMDSRP
jgi:23S rRNA (cytidine1920-2'-O)/16S rRNA (cytidine1409-2'-O)-methyltransferase